jgi:hypothetical protein
LKLDNADLWKDSGLVAINGAFLEFEVVPDSISGIDRSSLPDRMMLLTDRGDYQEVLYDFVVDAGKFDGYLRPVTEGIFFDTSYVYRFNIGLHYQNVIDGSLENYDLILKPINFQTSNNFVKLWSNYSRTQGSLRLKVVYTKFE